MYMKRCRVTFYKGRRRFTKTFRNYRKAMNAKMAMMKRKWKSSRIK